MAEDFGQLAARARAGWSDDERRAYDAASQVFADEVDAAARLGAQLRAARAADGLSQSELSTLTGFQQSEISRIERGLGNPTTETLSRLASATAMRLTLEPLAHG